MPTTQQEADTIVRTMLEHLPPEQVVAVASKLWERVGSGTANQSVRDTMLMLKDAVERAMAPPPIPLLGKMLIVPVVLSHWCVILGNCASCIAVLGAMVWGYTVPTWSLAFPIATLILWMMTSRNWDCPLTKIEDRIRRHYKRKPTVAFLRHYVVNPIRDRFGISK